MTKGDDFRAAADPGTFKYSSPDYQKQPDELIKISANLTDREKALAEYWSDGVATTVSAERWLDFARFISTGDHHTVDEDVKMYFVLTNALFDASIAAWDAKRTYDSVRPVTAISLLVIPEAFARTNSSTVTNRTLARVSKPLMCNGQFGSSCGQPPRVATGALRVRNRRKAQRIIVSFKEAERSEAEASE